MTDIMTQIIDEVGTSAQEIIEIILDQFVKHEKVKTQFMLLKVAHDNTTDTNSSILFNGSRSLLYLCPYSSKTSMPVLFWYSSFCQ